MSFEKLLPSGLKPDPDLTLLHISIAITLNHALNLCLEISQLVVLTKFIKKKI